MKNGSRNVGATYVLGDKVLDISLAENAAPRRYRISPFGAQGKVVQLVNTDIQKHGHLVDEGSRAAGAVAVHAQVGSMSVLEEHHLGVLAADIDER